MRNTFRKLWQSRAPQERLVVAMLVAVLGAALYLWLTQSAHRARLQLGSAVSQLRAEAIRLDKSANEIARLRATSATPQQQTAQLTDLRLLLQAQIDSAGLARSLVRIESVDASQVKVVFGAVAFADWLAWVENVQSKQIRLDATRIEALSTPGLVSVTTTFIRPKL